MKLKQIAVLLAALGIVTIYSCNSDDDGESLLPIAQRNEVDDEAIVLFLNNNYFNSVGKVTAFSDDTTEDDNETKLMDLATYNEMGYWYVKRPNYTANGRMVNNPANDSILIQYEMKTFQGMVSNDSVYYSTPSTYSSTINGTGYPIWDPSFYRVYITSDADDTNRVWYEMEGFVEGLKHFNSTERQRYDLPAVDFQGLIIFPSRLGFGRDTNALSFGNDVSVMVNFELYQVVDR